MYRFYRLDKDEKSNDILNVIDTCAIQGDRVPSVPETYHNILFHLGIGADDKVFVRRDYCVSVPDNIITGVEAWLNGAEEKKALPTYFHTHILLNGVERIPHLHLVYIAVNEQEVWDFINS